LLRVAARNRRSRTRGRRQSNCHVHLLGWRRKLMIRSLYFWVGLLWVFFITTPLIEHYLGVTIMEVKPGLEPLYGYPGIVIAFMPPSIFLLLARNVGTNGALARPFRWWAACEILITIAILIITSSFSITSKPSSLGIWAVKISLGVFVIS